MGHEREQISPEERIGAEIHPLQIVAWRRMGYEGKWALARKANHLLRESVKNRLRGKFPGMPEQEINHESSRFLLLSRT